MYISEGMKIATKWMEDNSVHGDPAKLEYHSIGHLLTRFADDVVNKNIVIPDVREPFLKWSDVAIGFLAGIFLTIVILGQIFNAL